MESYLYVCKNNVGRSQMAMAYHNQVRPGEAASAGTHVDEPGGIVANWDGGPVEIIEAMLEDGIDIAENRRTQLTSAAARQFGRIIIMTEPELIPDFLGNDARVDYWPFDDPHGMSLEQTRLVRDQIKNSIGLLVSRLVKVS